MTIEFPVAIPQSTVGTSPGTWTLSLGDLIKSRPRSARVVETRNKLLCKTNIVKDTWERGRIHDGTQYAKACFTMQGAHVANVVHGPKRTTKYNELYRYADELTKKRPCMSAMN